MFLESLPNVVIALFNSSPTNPPMTLPAAAPTGPPREAPTAVPTDCPIDTPIFARLALKLKPPLASCFPISANSEDTEEPRSLKKSPAMLSLVFLNSPSIFPSSASILVTDSVSELSIILLNVSALPPPFTNSARSASMPPVSLLRS